jgi:hypothetical protein
MGTGGSEERAKTVLHSEPAIRELETELDFLRRASRYLEE